MTKEGHVRLKRWYDPSEDDYADLTDKEVYFDSIGKQYKIKASCDDCGVFLGWYCYPTDKMKALLYELTVGFYCTECHLNNDYDVDIEDCEVFEGQRCKSGTVRTKRIRDLETNKFLSIEEVKKLMGFPGEYKICGGVSIQQKQLGNAVCPPIAKTIAEGIISNEQNQKHR